MDTLQHETNQTRHPNAPRAGWTASIGVAALAVAVAVGVRLVATALGIDVQVGSTSTRHGVGPGAVAIVSAVAALCGVLGLQLAQRRFARGRRWWTIGASVVLFGSLPGPLQATAVSSWLVLTVLHLVTGAVVILGLRRVSGVA